VEHVIVIAIVIILTRHRICRKASRMECFQSIQQNVSM